MILSALFAFKLPDDERSPENCALFEALSRPSCDPAKLADPLESLAEPATEDLPLPSKFELADPLARALDVDFASMDEDARASIVDAELAETADALLLVRALVDLSLNDCPFSA